MECGGVVDAIAHETDDVALRLEAADNALLVAGGELGEDVVRFDGSRQRGIIHPLDVIPQQGALLRQADFAANLGCDQFVISCQHLDGDAVLGKGFEGRGGGVFGRIKEGDIADQGQLTLVGQAIDFPGRRPFPGGYGNDAQAFFVEIGRQVADARQQFGRQGLDGIAVANLGAHRQDFFDSTFCNEQVMFVVLGHDDRHAAAGEVEGDFVDLAEIFGRLQIARDFGMFQYRHIQKIFKACLVIAVEIGQFQNLVGIRAPDIDMTGEKNLVLGECACLVGAQYVHRAKILDGVQPFDDDFFA